ncbi:MAG TPA: hypothetical protein PK858_11510, partial [Saprospiraceae bacterium]|nr:hypothetical protein [Saprospiraceae bacterium]
KGTYQSNEMIETFQVSIQDIIDLTPETPQCVVNVPMVCVEKGTYIFERELPVDDVDSYFVVYQRCCRNNTINNIIDPGSVGATYYAELTPAAQKACNNSPVYTNFPPIIICAGYPLNFDHSATDADGDLLLYSFFAPLAGGGPILTFPGVNSCNGAIPTPPCNPPFDEVVFTAPTYKPDNPMGGNPQVTINGITGLITGTPTIQGQFVVGIKVEEYRNGVLLSVLRREFQFNVTDCTPTLYAEIKSDSVAGPKSYVVQSCGDFTVDFINQSKPRTNVETQEWEFDLKNGTVFKSKEWDASVSFPAIGTYTGILRLNPGSQCADSAYITVNIFPEIKADFSFDYDTCVAGPVAFTDLSTGNGIIDRWAWTFGVPNAASTE